MTEFTLHPACHLAPYVLRGLCSHASSQVWKFGSILILSARELKHWEVGFFQGHLIDLRQAVMELRAIKSLCPGADKRCGLGQIFRATEDQGRKATVCAGDLDL